MDIKEFVSTHKTGWGGLWLFSSSSIKFAQSLLKPAETVKFALVAMASSNFGGEDKSIVVATNDRVLYVSKRLWNVKSKYIRIPDIQSVEMNRGLVNGSLVIKGLTESIVIKHWKKKSLMAFQTVVEELVNEYRKIREESQVVSNKTKEEKSQKEQLDEISELLNNGYITQEEFDKKRKQILGL